MKIVKKSPGAKLIGPPATRRRRAYVVARRVLRDRSVKLGIAILLVAVVVVVLAAPPIVAVVAPTVPDIIDRVLDALD